MVLYKLPSNNNNNYATGRLCKGSGVRFPGRPARSEITFWGLYVRRIQFTGTVLVLGPTIWVQFLLVPLVVHANVMWCLNSGQTYCTLCPSSLKYQSTLYVMCTKPPFMVLNKCSGINNNNNIIIIIIIIIIVIGSM